MSFGLCRLVLLSTMRHQEERRDNRPGSGCCIECRRRCDIARSDDIGVRAVFRQYFSGCSRHSTAFMMQTQRSRLRPVLQLQAKLSLRPALQLHAASSISWPAVRVLGMPTFDLFPRPILLHCLPFERSPLLSLQSDRSTLQLSLLFISIFVSLCGPHSERRRLWPTNMAATRFADGPSAQAFRYLFRDIDWAPQQNLERWLTAESRSQCSRELAEAKVAHKSVRRFKATMERTSATTAYHDLDSTASLYCGLMTELKRTAIDLRESQDCSDINVWTLTEKGSQIAPSSCTAHAGYSREEEVGSSSSIY